MSKRHTWCCCAKPDIEDDWKPLLKEKTGQNLHATQLYKLEGLNEYLKGDINPRAKTESESSAGENVQTILSRFHGQGGNQRKYVHQLYPDEEYTPPVFNSRKGVSFDEQSEELQEHVERQQKLSSGDSQKPTHLNNVEVEIQIQKEKPPRDQADDKSQSSSKTSERPAKHKRKTTVTKPPETNLTSDHSLSATLSDQIMKLRCSNEQVMKGRSSSDQVLQKCPSSDDSKICTHSEQCVSSRVSSNKSHRSHESSLKNNGELDRLPVGGESDDVSEQASNSASDLGLYQSKQLPEESNSFLPKHDQPSPPDLFTEDTSSTNQIVLPMESKPSNTQPTPNIYMMHDIQSRKPKTILRPAKSTVSSRKRYAQSHGLGVTAKQEHFSTSLNSRNTPRHGSPSNIPRAQIRLPRNPRTPTPQRPSSNTRTATPPRSNRSPVQATHIPKSTVTSRYRYIASHNDRSRSPNPDRQNVKSPERKWTSGGKSRLAETSKPVQSAIQGTTAVPKTDVKKTMSGSPQSSSTCNTEESKQTEIVSKRPPMARRSPTIVQAPMRYRTTNKLQVQSRPQSPSKRSPARPPSSNLRRLLPKKGQPQSESLPNRLSSLQNELKNETSTSSQNSSVQDVVTTYGMSESCHTPLLKDGCKESDEFPRQLSDDVTHIIDCILKDKPTRPTSVQSSDIIRVNRQSRKKMNHQRTLPRTDLE